MVARKLEEIEGEFPYGYINEMPGLNYRLKLAPSEVYLQDEGDPTKRFYAYCIKWVSAVGLYEDGTRGVIEENKVGFVFLADEKNGEVPEDKILWIDFSCLSINWQLQLLSELLG